MALRPEDPEDPELEEAAAAPGANAFTNCGGPCDPPVLGFLGGEPADGGVDLRLVLLVLMSVEGGGGRGRGGK